MGEPVRATVDVEVRYAETDQMGVVHHAHYLVWFELARTRLCARSGFHYRDIEEAGHLLVVTGAELQYRQPARYGDIVQIACWLSRYASRTLGFGYRVERDGDLLCRGETRHVWLDRESRRPTRIPEALATSFSALAGEGPAGGEETGPLDVAD